MTRTLAVAALIVASLAACGGDVAGPLDAGSSGNAGVGGAGGAGGTPVVECDAFTPGDALNVCTATYLATSSSDEAAAVELSPDGHVIYGGVLGEGENFGATPTTLLDGTTGLVLRLSADGREVASVTRIGARVNDIAVNPIGGDIAVAGDFGVALLGPDAQTVRFRSAVGVGGRVAVGSDGTVAVLVDKRVSVFDSSGGELGSFDVAVTELSDMTLDGQTHQVFVTGFKQDDGAPCTQLQIPFIRAYTYSGELAWRAYDWNRTEIGAQQECADSRGIAVSIGRDGKLYYAGESHGGNTVHRRDPQDVTTMTDAVTITDKYTNPYNINGAAPVMFFARFDPSAGRLENSQRLVVRLPSNDKGNAVRPTSIAADESGNILIGGGSACCVPDAEAKTVNGLAAYGDYAGGPFVLVVSADFTQRLLWTSLRGASGENGDVVGVVAGSGRMAMALTQTFDDSATVANPFITAHAVGSTPGGGASDGYVAVWRGPEP